MDTFLYGLLFIVSLCSGIRDRRGIAPGGSGFHVKTRSGYSRSTCRWGSISLMLKGFFRSTCRLGSYNRVQTTLVIQWPYPYCALITLTHCGMSEMSVCERFFPNKCVKALSAILFARMVCLCMGASAICFVKPTGVKQCPVHIFLYNFQAICYLLQVEMAQTLSN